MFTSKPHFQLVREVGYMDTQYFVVERLEEKGGDRMESALTELE
jgi:hypothetical protein